MNLYNKTPNTRKNLLASIVNRFPSTIRQPIPALCFASVVLFSGAETVQAATISINLIPDINNDASLDAGDLDLAPSDVAGVVPAANWNNAFAGTGNDYGGFSTTDLIDVTGAVTSASFAYASTGQGGRFVTAGPMGTPDEKMMKAALGTWEAGESVSYTVSGLSADFTGPGYLVYAYLGGRTADFGGSDEKTIDLYTMTAPGATGDGATFVMGYQGHSSPGNHWNGVYNVSTFTALGDFNDPEDFAVYNYIRFDGLTSSSFTIHIEAEGADRRHGMLSGIQIVAIPEPSAYAALVGFIGLAMALLRRRRRS